MFSLLKSPAAAARFGLGGILALTAAFLLAAQGVHSADDPPDPDELTDAPPGSSAVEARLLQTFPGAREVPGAAPPGADR